jgi:hypothetical protein
VSGEVGLFMWRTERRLELRPDCRIARKLGEVALVASGGFAAKGRRYGCLAERFNGEFVRL